MKHVHKHCAPSTIIRAKAGTIGVPHALRLPDLVGASFTMHCVHMGYEQCPASVVNACVYMQVATLVIADGDVIALG
jgi:hypothetical protein